MIVKSRVTGEWALEAFETFHVDTMLPKFHRPKPTPGPSGVGQKQGGFRVVGETESSDITMSMPDPSWGISNGDGSGLEKGPGGWKYRLVWRLERLLGVARRPKERPHGNMDPLRILLDAKASLGYVRDCMTRIETYDKALQQAVQGGQVARASQLMKARQVVVQESILRAAGFSKFLSEKQLVEFASKCQKGLRLDWVANFVRPFPPSVLARKVEADALKVFDNYAVLHYDPRQKAFALTPAQEAAKRDPILFGLIDGVRKLYFVGDWKDDECDLTMEEVARVLGREPAEIGEDPTVEP